MSGNVLSHSCPIFGLSHVFRELALRYGFKVEIGKLRPPTIYLRESLARFWELIQKVANSICESSESRYIYINPRNINFIIFFVCVTVSTVDPNYIIKLCKCFQLRTVTVTTLFYHNWCLFCHCRGIPQTFMRPLPQMFVQPHRKYWGRCRKVINI